MSIAKKEHTRYEYSISNGDVLVVFETDGNTLRIMDVDNRAFDVELEDVDDLIAVLKEIREAANARG